MLIKLLFRPDLTITAALASPPQAGDHPEVEVVEEQQGAAAFASRKRAKVFAQKVIDAATEICCCCCSIAVATAVAASYELVLVRFSHAPHFQQTPFLHSRDTASFSSHAPALPCRLSPYPSRCLCRRSCLWSPSSMSGRHHCHPPRPDSWTRR